MDFDLLTSYKDVNEASNQPPGYIICISHNEKLSMLRPCVYIYAPALAGLQLGGLVVKTLSCCAVGPSFDPRVKNPKYSTDLHQQNPSWWLFG